MLEGPRFARGREVLDGLVLLGVMPEDYAREIVEKGVPVVVVDNWFKNIDTEYVVADNVSGAKAAVEHLVAKGHKSIGFLGG